MHFGEKSHNGFRLYRLWVRFASRRQILLWLNTLLPLAVGSTIYLLGRPTNILVFRLFPLLGWEDSLFRLRQFVRPFFSVLPEFALYSLPNALWTYSFAVYFLIIWRDTRVYGWAAVSWGVSLAFEGGQLVGWVPGIFSLPDFIAIILAIVFSYICIRLTLKSSYSHV